MENTKADTVVVTGSKFTVFLGTGTDAEKVSAATGKTTPSTTNRAEDARKVDEKTKVSLSCAEGDFSPGDAPVRVV